MVGRPWTESQDTELLATIGVDDDRTHKVRAFAAQHHRSEGAVRMRLTTLKNQSPKKPATKEDAIDRVAAALVMATGVDVDAQWKSGVTPSLGDQIYEAAAALFRQRLERMPPDAKSPLGALVERDTDTYTLTPRQASSIMALSLSMMYPGIVKKILREPRRVVELARLFPEGDAVQQALDILTTESPAGNKH